MKLPEAELALIIDAVQGLSDPVSIDEIQGRLSGKTSRRTLQRRLAANIPLVQRNLCPLSFIDVPQGNYLYGTIAVYELNRIEYLRDVFVWAYQRSCARLSAVRQSLGKPDPFRLKYRLQIGHAVAEVVRSGMDKRQAVKWLKGQAVVDIPKDDVDRFLDVAETELSSLHEGNIARFRLRPSEFQSWSENWR